LSGLGGTILIVAFASKSRTSPFWFKPKSIPPQSFLDFLERDHGSETEHTRHVLRELGILK
jgi:hypothetical protein